MSNTRNTPLVLVADDDPTTQVLAEETLSANGFRVITSGDGAQARTLFEQYQPEALLLDVNMPGQSGLELCAAIRADYDAAVPIIMMTAAEDVDVVPRAYRVGATDFVAKPVHWQTLPYRLRHAISARQLGDALREQRGRTDIILKALPDDLLLLDERGFVREVLTTGVTSIASSSSNRASLEDLLPAGAAREARERLGAALGSQCPQTFEFEHADGRHVVEARIVPESEHKAIVILRDITQRARSEERIRRLAYFDAVTGLPNRQLFIRELRRAMRHAKRTNTNCAVLYVDLDRFKRINDTLGHSVGDALLKSVAQRLERCIRPSDFLATATHVARDEQPVTRQLARLGGDEFVVLLNELDVREAAGAVAARVRKALAAPFTYEKRQFVVTPSIGIATYPDDGKDVETLLMRADTAMYNAKSAGRNTMRFYETTMDASALERLDLEEDLRQALARDELSLNYQAKVSLTTGRLTGAEALLRWHHPQRGWISPAQFVPVAEETGLIVPIGQWVVREACAQIRRWHEDGIDGICVSVNVSPEQVARSDVADLVLKSIWENGIKPQLLEVEITESLLIQDAKDVKAVLARLREGGIQLAMDDFGTGYSSLSYLQQFPLDALKIDRSFVLDLHRDGDNAAICAAIIAMANKLGLRVIAEGIELEEQRDFLRRAGCDEGQGYLFNRPMGADEFATLVRNWDSAVVIADAATASPTP